jgi:ATP-binding protein involved in chromosome partitioning
MPLPIEIVGLGKSEVRFVWDEGHEGVYSVRELRLACNCAHCVSEDTGRRMLDPTSVPEGLTIASMELAGNYGLRVDFSDGHNTGIFRFADLLEDCPCDLCHARRNASPKKP